MTLLQGRIRPYLHWILSQYDLGEIFSLHKTYGVIHTVPYYVIVTDRGKFILKSRVDKQAMKFECAVLYHLGARIPFSEQVVKTKDGACHTEQAGTYYIIVRCFDGIQVPYPFAALTREMKQESGRALAGIHLALNDFDIASYPRSENVFNLCGLSAVKKKLSTWGVVVSKQDVRSAVEDQFAAIHRVLGEQIDLLALRFRPDVLARLPHCVIHGDYHPLNIFFKDSRVAGVIDWEGCSFAPRIFDLAHQYFLLQPQLTAMRRRGYWGRPGRQLDLALCEGYDEVIALRGEPLSGEERFFLPDALRFKLLRSIYGRLAILFDMGFNEEGLVQTLRDQLKLLELFAK